MYILCRKATKFLTFRIYQRDLDRIMENIIAPIDKELLKKELTEEKLVRNTRNASNQIFRVNAENSPNVLLEIGRLRELSFRGAGGGTGKSLDLDRYDLEPNCYNQLVVWDPTEEQIVGGYRYILCRNATMIDQNSPDIATSSLFRFSKEFIENYFPHTIELGRSFVQPAYQSPRDNRKSIYALDNLWEGLGTLAVDYSNIKFFFGKVTMYPQFNKKARDLILFFLKKFFPDPEKLIFPIKPLKISSSARRLEKIFTGESITENFNILAKEVRKYNETIPPLFNSYSSLSATMKTFGTALNESFGGVEETGILITISDIYEAKSERYIKSYFDSKIKDGE